MENLCASFKLFGVSHIVYLLIAIATCITIVLLLRKNDGKTRQYISIGLVSASGVFALLEFAGRLLNDVNVMENLPLNQVHILAFIIIYVEITNKQSWIKFNYFITLPISVVSLFIVPNFYTTLSATSLSTISFFVVNIALIVYSLLKLFWSDVYLTKKDIMNVTLNYVIIIAFIHIINVIFRFTPFGTNANYWGTIGEEYDVLTALFAKGISMPFVHIIILLAVLVLIEFLLFIPFDLLKTRKEKQAHIEELVALGNLKAQQDARKEGKDKSQILVRSETKAKPTVEKRTYNEGNAGEFLSVNKTIQVNNDEHSDK